VIASDFGKLMPELVLVVAAALIIVADVASSRRRTDLYSLIAAAGLLLSAWLSVRLGPDRPQLLLGNMAALDAFSVFFMPVFAGASLLAVLFSLRSGELTKERHAEYLALVMLFTAGMMLVAAASSLVMLYLSMEMIGICAYALTAFNPGHPRSSEAGLKYAVFGAVASGIMLFGISIFYGLTGALDYPEIRRALPSLVAADGPQTALLVVAVVFITGGFAYKIAAVPFHAWCPDAYEGAPTPFTALMSVAPKAAGFAALTRFFYTVLSNAHSGGNFEPALDVPWPAVLGVIAFLTMTLGNFSAITQSNLKRMLAYSSIAHAGYMLMGVVALSSEGAGALCAYVVIYLIMNMGAFLAVLAVSGATGGEEISDWRGMGKRLPLVGVAMAVFLFSLTGLPPFAGFVGKFYLFAAVVSRGGFWYWVLAVAGILNSVVSLYYYARIVRAMYLEEPVSTEPLAIDPGQKYLLLVLAAATILLGIFWTPLSELVARAVSFV